MDTFGDLVADVVNETRRSMSDVIANLVLDSIAYYSGERFPFNEFTGSFSVSSSQDTYTSVDASFIPQIADIDAVRLTVSTADKPTLRKLNWTQLEELNYPSSTGQPYAYAYWGQSMRFYPIPNGGYEVRVSGVLNETSLSLSTDSNSWTTRGEGKELVKQRTKSLLYSEYLRDDANAGRAAGREQQELERLKKRLNRPQGTSTIVPSL